MNKKKIIFRVFVFWWIGLCFHTLIYRPLIRKKRFSLYKKLFHATREEKKAILLGQELYDFVQFCNQNLPPESTYSLVGLDLTSIEYQRASYYLFPHLTLLPEKNGKIDFILVFQKEIYAQEGYELYKRMDKKHFILRRNNQ